MSGIRNGGRTGGHNGITRIALIVFMFCISCANLFAISAYGTGRTNAMGRIGTSGMESDISYFQNPAAIYYYNQRKKFLYENYIYDSHNPNDYYMIERPDMGFKIQFTGRGVALSMGVDKFVDSFVKHSDTKTYNFRQRFDLSASFAWGYKNLALGAGLYGGSYMGKSDVILKNSRFFSDWVRYMFFSEYTRDSNSEFVDIEVGLMYRLEGFVFSVKCDELLSYIAVEEDALTFNNAVDTIGAAVYFSTDPYAPRGHLKKWHFAVGAEGKNIPSSKNRTVHFGAEATRQLARNYNVSFRLGYYTKPKDFFDGSVTAGVGTRINRFDVSLSVNVPLSVIKDDTGDYTVGLNVMYLF